jgi:hypothetical protein
MCLETTRTVAGDPVPEDAPERLTPELVLVCPELARFDPAMRLDLDKPAPTAPPAPLQQPEPKRKRPATLAWPLVSAFAPHVAVPIQAPVEKARSSRVRMLLSLVGAALIATMASATFTFAMTGNRSSQATDPLPMRADALVVPEVVGLPYVFAKGVLHDAGYSWRVEGNIKGYAGNIVASQEPAAGTRLTAKDAAAIVLRLERNPEYEERGVPENSSR